MHSLQPDVSRYTRVVNVRRTLCTDHSVYDRTSRLERFRLDSLHNRYKKNCVDIMNLRDALQRNACLPRNPQHCLLSGHHHVHSAPEKEVSHGGDTRNFY